MQSVLSQQEQKEEQLDIPVADAVMEARREINMCKAYPQDVTLSTLTLGCVHSISFWMGMSSYKSQISIYLRGTWRMGLWMQKVMRKWGCNHRYTYLYVFSCKHSICIVKFKQGICLCFFFEGGVGDFRGKSGETIQNPHPFPPPGNLGDLSEESGILVAPMVLGYPTIHYIDFHIDQFVLKHYSHAVHPIF